MEEMKERKRERKKRRKDRKKERTKDRKHRNKESERERERRRDRERKRVRKLRDAGFNIDRPQLGDDQRTHYFMEYNSTSNHHFNHFKYPEDFTKAFFEIQDTAFTVSDGVMAIACASDFNRLGLYTSVNLFPGLLDRAGNFSCVSSPECLQAPQLR